MVYLGYSQFGLGNSWSVQRGPHNQFKLRKQLKLGKMEKDHCDVVSDVHTTFQITGQLK